MEIITIFEIFTPNSSGRMTLSKYNFKLYLERVLLLAAQIPPIWEGSGTFMGRVFSKKTRPYFEYEHEIRTILRDLKSVLVYYLTPLQKQECVVLEHTVYLQRGGGPSIEWSLVTIFFVFSYFIGFFRFFIVFFIFILTYN